MGNNLSHLGDLVTLATKKAYLQTMFVWMSVDKLIACYLMTLRYVPPDTETVVNFLES